MKSDDVISLPSRGERPSPNYAPRHVAQNPARDPNRAGFISHRLGVGHLNVSDTNFPIGLCRVGWDFGCPRRRCHRCASCRRSAFEPHCGLRTASAMRNEHSGKYTPRPPRCPSCARIMRLARASRFGDLYIQYVFECRACGVSHIDAVEIEAA